MDLLTAIINDIPLTTLSLIAMLVVIRYHNRVTEKFQTFIEESDKRRLQSDQLTAQALDRRDALNQQIMTDFIVFKKDVTGALEKNGDALLAVAKVTEHVVDRMNQMSERMEILDKATATNIAENKQRSDETQKRLDDLTAGVVELARESKLTADALAKLIEAVVNLPKDLRNEFIAALEADETRKAAAAVKAAEELSQGKIEEGKE